ncbi:MAG: hypothetical protein JXR60_01490 [Bacteroidales bacterium]|nr:hypothetical protein [Bacteroidales bacterium]
MKAFLFSIALSIASSFYLFGQNTTITANSYDISDNLDLQAVLSVFAEAKDLEDFERKLNDPESQISNIDLNGDNYVDYLRVVEISENRTHLIIIQSVLGNDKYQDIATIETEKGFDNNYTVQIIGNSYIYGDNYVIRPVFYRSPNLLVFLYGPYYRSWASPYYWGYYPSYYKYWHPYTVNVYHKRIYTHVNHHHHYNYVHSYRPHHHHLYSRASRSDYRDAHPNRTHSKPIYANNRVRENNYKQRNDHSNYNNQNNRQTQSNRSTVNRNQSQNNNSSNHHNSNSSKPKVNNSNKSKDQKSTSSNRNQSNRNRTSNGSAQRSSR